MNDSYYDASFYSKHDAWSLNSARVVVPLVFDLIKPASVVDIGCGNGTWLKALLEIDNRNEILGIDGDYVERKQLHIPAERFVPHDLSNALHLDKRYDLVISLEVGEHLPADKADVYVRTLINAGNVILFSAAFPGQGGTNHINEQFPDYWAEKFKQHGYQFYDVIRPLILENHVVERWYRQNLFLVVKDDVSVSLNMGTPGLTAINRKLFERLEHYQRLVEGKGGVREGVNIFLRSVKKRFFSK